VATVKVTTLGPRKHTWQLDCKQVLSQAQKPRGPHPPMSLAPGTKSQEQLPYSLRVPTSFHPFCF
jgi:hypothetical protein